MERRDFLTTSALAAASAATFGAAGIAFAAEHGKDNDLVGTATSCVKTGELCQQHCIDMLSAGDTSMADCAKSVRDMLIYCNALREAAIQKSKHLKQIAKIALASCQDCEAQCRKHSKHIPCKNCAEACTACIEQCKAATA